MGERSAIEWTDASWTPIRARNRVTGEVGWHCEHATPGCAGCYAESLNARLGTGLPFKPGHRKDIELFLDETMLTAPLRWRRPRMIFVCSMTDIFAEFVPDEWIDKVFAVMALAPRHTFQVLTKRSARMRDWAKHARVRAPAANELRHHIAHMAGGDRGSKLGRYAIDNFMPWPLPNVWLGVSAEDQERADQRIPDLLATLAALRFLSAEPLLGEINLTFDTEVGPCTWLKRYDFGGEIGKDNRTARLDWVIVGGESGDGARPMHPDWVRSLRDQCVAAGVPFFFKQWGKWGIWDQAKPWIPSRGCALTADGKAFTDARRIKATRPETAFCLMQSLGKKAAGRLLDGREWNDMPASVQREAAA